MPFDTVEHSHKRLRYDGSWEDPQDVGYQSFIASPLPPPSHNWNNSTLSAPSFLDLPYWKPSSSNIYQPEPLYKMDDDTSCYSTSSQSYNRKPSTSHSQFTSSPTSDHEALASPVTITQQDTDLNSYTSPTTPKPTATNIEFCRVRDILSKCSVSYSSTGVNVEAKVTSATELRSLIDAFSQLCPSTTALASTPPPTSPLSTTSNGTTLFRNKLYKSKPVNFFASVCNLSHLIMPPSNKSNALTLRQLGDACIDTYFSCWVRYSRIVDKNEFMAWYQDQADPMNTLIVNAICSLVFSHTVNHHSKPGLEKFKHDQDLVRQQQDLFFDRARKYLELTFDSPDRWTVVALMYMSCTAEPERRHHYSGMAMSALLELEIYPRMAADSEDDSFDKEMDTRLWWFAWSLDFYL